jgi:hypothetical protein
MENGAEISIHDIGDRDMRRYIGKYNLNGQSIICIKSPGSALANGDTCPVKPPDLVF